MTHGTPAGMTASQRVQDELARMGEAIKQLGEDKILTGHYLYQAKITLAMADGRLSLGQLDWAIELMYVTVVHVRGTTFPSQIIESRELQRLAEAHHPRGLDLVREYMGDVTLRPGELARHSSVGSPVPRTSTSLSVPELAVIVAVATALASATNHSIVVVVIVAMLVMALARRMSGRR